MSPARWCPTPEQLMILEEMYKSGGIRTPNASQIQQITAHLSYYGKIEGKNVFYWFQNHKARDRQKLRRKLIKQQQQNQQNTFFHDHSHAYYHDHSHAFSPTPHQLSNCTTAAFLPQGGFHEEASTKVMNYTWKVEKPVMRMYGRDWTMIMDVGPISSPCQNGPLKTLDLFPITATNLKDEGNITSSKPCSTTSSN